VTDIVPASNSRSSPPNNSIDPTGEIARLAALSRIEYDRQRRPVAEVLGIRVETLDDEVKQARKTADPAQGAADSAQGKAVVVREVEPWPDPGEAGIGFGPVRAGCNCSLTARAVSTRLCVGVPCQRRGYPALSAYISPPSGPEWLIKIKHDGFRVIARNEGKRVRLYSRPGNDLTHRFPLMVEALASLRPRSCSALSMGEAVSCSPDGIASFDGIRYRRHDADVFMWASDLVELNGDGATRLLCLPVSRGRNFCFDGMS
jgi:hypothetical protein